MDFKYPIGTGNVVSELAPPAKLNSTKEPPPGGRFCIRFSSIPICICRFITVFNNADRSCCLRYPVVPDHPQEFPSGHVRSHDHPGLCSRGRVHGPGPRCGGALQPGDQGRWDGVRLRPGGTCRTEWTAGSLTVFALAQWLAGSLPLSSIASLFHCLALPLPFFRRWCRERRILPRRTSAARRSRS